MWVIFEGLDKTGKTTLEWELLKATNFKYVVIDRGPVGYMTFDKIFGRETTLGNQEFIRQAQKVMKLNDFIVVYCTAEKETVKERLMIHDETCPYDYVKAQKLYRDNIHKYYKPEKTLELDTTNKSVGECIELIIKKLKEAQQGELQECK